MALYTTYLFIFFPLRIRNYQYNVYSANPGKASFTKQLARLLNSTVFLFAVIGMVMILITILYQVGTNPMIQTILIILVWLPITFMFILNQVSLSRIITRAKIRKLTEIENEISNLEQSKNIADKENLEAINRLMDYHERVQKTRNSSLDFRAILNFLNSLLIPALGFIIDTLIKFLSRGP